MAYIDGKEILFSAQIEGGAGNNIELVQEMGDDEFVAMSQKATTKAIKNAAVDNIINSSENLFNANDEDIKAKSYISFSGEIKTAGTVSISGKINVKPNEIYCITANENINSTTLGYQYTADGDPIKNIEGEISDDRKYYTFRSSVNASYILINFYTGEIGKYMVVEGEKYPSEYKAYGLSLKNDFNLNETQKREVKDIVENGVNNYPLKDDRLKELRSANLYNYNTAIDGYYFAPYSGELVSNSGNSINYVELDGLGTYITKVNTGTFGVINGAKIAIFDKNKNYLGAAEGTLTEGTTVSKPDAELLVTIDFENAYYAGLTVHKNYKNTIMFVKGTEYPAKYIPYETHITIENLKIDVPIDCERNILYGKELVCDGDSICNGGSVGSSSEKQYYGWCGRIGEKNGMIWSNKGIGGATITAETYSDSGTPKHWISRNIDTIYSKHPNLDYLILEGGTNDADSLTENKLGVLDISDYDGTYDDTTFYGALDSLFYKALNYYPNAKIGFIIAHRMGGGTYNFGDTNKRRSYFLKAIEVCKKWAIPYIDLWETCTLTPALSCFYDKSMTKDENIAAGKAYTDGQHLSDVGYDIITPKIEAWIKTL